MENSSTQIHCEAILKASVSHITPATWSQNAMPPGGESVHAFVTDYPDCSLLPWATTGILKAKGYIKI